VKSALIAGSGGQGILFLGKLLAHAAMIAGRNVTWFPSYGAEMRGGTANCTVVISEEIIGSPVVKSPDVLVVLNEASKDRFESRLKEGGLLLMDSSLIHTPPKRRDIRTVTVPAAEMASALGSPMSANMVMLGALLDGEGLISEEEALAALEEMTPPGRKNTLGRNAEAIRRGKAHRENQESNDR